MSRKSVLLVFFLAIFAGFLTGRFFTPHQTGGESIDSQPGNVATGPEQTTRPGGALEPAPSSGQRAAVSAELANLSLDEKLRAIDQLELTASLDNSIRTLQLIASMSESELRTMLNDLSQGGMGSMNDWMIPYYAFTSWVEKNPQNAYRFLQEEANPMQQQMYGNALFSSWASIDPDGALAAIEQISEKQKQEQAYGAVTMAIAGKDPNRAFELLASRESSNSWQYQMLFRLWAGQNLDAALQKIETMDYGQERTHALSGAIGGMAAQDMRQAAQFAVSLEREDERNQALQSVMHNWINQDMEGALQFLQTLDPGRDKNNLIQGSIWGLARNDPERALAFVQTEMSGQAQDNAISNIISQMAREEPEKAAALAATLPFGRVYSRTIQSIASQWGNEDPVAALAWASSLDESEEKERALSSVYRGLAKNQLDEAIVYLNQMDSEKGRSELAGHIAQQIANKDPKEALLWTRTLGTEDLVEKASETALATWAAQDPQDLIAYLETSGEAKLLEKHSHTIALSWARTDVNAAATWALSLSGDTRTKAIEQVSREWLQHNSEEASIWISQLEAGPARDGAVGNLVSAVYRSAPEAAFTWATTIADERDRYRSVRRVVAEMKSDGETEEAEAMVNQSNLPASEKDKLLGLLN